MMRLRPAARPLRALLDADAKRVLVAITLHSDEDGLTCRMGDDALAESASVSREALAYGLRTLTDAGWIRILIIPDGHPQAGRVIVLMDHEAAGWYLTETRRSIRVFNHPHG